MSDGLPYWVTMPFAGTPLIEIDRLQTSSSDSPQRLAAGEVEGFDNYAGWSFQSPVVSDGNIYWIPPRSAVDVEIWSYDIMGSTGQFELFKSFSVQLSGVSSLPHIDVDGRYFAAYIEHGSGQVLDGAVSGGAFSGDNELPKAITARGFGAALDDAAGNAITQRAPVQVYVKSSH